MRFALRWDSVGKPRAARGAPSAFVFGVSRNCSGVTREEARDEFHRAAMDRATNADDVMALHGLRAHQLIGKDKGFIPVWVNGNWRITFKFTGEDVELVDTRD